MMGFGFGMGTFGLVWMLLFWGGLIMLAIWLVGLLFPPAKGQSNDKRAPASALEILKARYANGELTRQQYQEMLNTIQK